MEDIIRLEITEMPWMCRVKLRSRVSNEKLQQWSIESVSGVVRRGRLSWCGYVERKEKNSSVSKCREIQVIGVRGRCRSKKTWIEGIKEDMKKLDIENSDSLDREE